VFCGWIEEQCLLGIFLCAQACEKTHHRKTNTWKLSLLTGKTCWPWIHRLLFLPVVEIFPPLQVKCICCEFSKNGGGNIKHRQSFRFTLRFWVQWKKSDLFLIRSFFRIDPLTSRGRLFWLRNSPIVGKPMRTWVFGLYFQVSFNAAWFSFGTLWSILGKIGHKRRVCFRAGLLCDWQFATLPRWIWSLPCFGSNNQP